MDLKQFPRTYSIEARVRRAIYALAMAPPALVIGGSLLQLAGLVIKPFAPAALLAMGFLAGLYALVISRSAKERVVLYEDGIEVLGGLFSARKLKRSEILGRRIIVASRYVWGPRYIIIPADKTVKELRLPPCLSVDKDFFSWMEEIPIIKNRGQGT
jgi:hypothetical protein